MCGIIGYVGGQKATPIVINGLHRLEYRGYDSAGLVVQTDEGLELTKRKGRLAVLEEALHGNHSNGTTGMGHTRWATHGKPSDVNSHPHTDCTGKYAVIHNGIIDNYLELKEQLINEGHRFISETDTEVVAHLLENIYDGCLLRAAQQLAPRLRGSYVLLFMCEQEPATIVAIRRDNPLIIGLGDGENFLASDIPAILPHTRKVIVVEDGEVVRVRQSGVEIINEAGVYVTRDPMTVQWDVEAAEKGGYAHFMLKEIFEQPRAVRNTLSGRIDSNLGTVNLAELGITHEEILRLKRVYIIGCGTASYAGQMGKFLIEGIARIPVEVDIASEFRYRSPLIEKDSLVIVLSQSGETLDTLAAMREAKRLGAKTLGITNVVGSSVAREADHVLYTWAGPEIAVASTKCFVAQLIALSLFSLYCAQERNALAATELGALVNALCKMPEIMDEALKNKRVAELAEKYAKYDHAFFIGRGLDAVVALEGSHKLKEIAYVFAEAYPGGELKHGALALVTEHVPVVAVATQPDLYEKTIGSIKEVKAREARVLAIVTEGDTTMEKVVDDVLHIPVTAPIFAGIVAIVPLQMLSYLIAAVRGCDIDKPRNLAKSVTVE